MDKEILATAVKALDEKKAEELSAVEIEDLTTIADVFVFATATSSTHVRALAEAVEEKLSAAGVEPHHIEGKATDWVLLDYGSVVIHIFGRKSREYYRLERLWSDGKPVDLGQFLSGESA